MQNEPNSQKSKMSIGEKMMSVPRQVLYLILLVVATVPLFFNILLPNTPSPSSIALYKNLMSIPKGSTVLLSSDWTNGTRGENAAQFDAVVKILMRQGIKAVVYSIGDAQAPQVARDEIDRINQEAKAANLPTYDHWKDWVVAGFFSSGDGTVNSMAQSVRQALGGKTDIDDQGNASSIFSSPVLEHVQGLADLAAIIDVTPSSTTTVYNKYVSGKVKLLMAVTGVMGPEETQYFESGQESGLAIGIKGGYDLEMLLEQGVGCTNNDGKTNCQIPGFPGEPNYGRAAAYYPTLHGTLALLILAVVVGNVGVVLSRKKAS